MSIEREQTLDSILGGRLRLLQPRRGYRFSVDSVLLARFARPSAGARVLDLGSGCGIVGLAVAALNNIKELAAIEVQPELAQLIARNAELNRLDHVRVLAADLRAHPIAGLDPDAFDLALANPPYRAAGRGRTSPGEQRRMARSEAGGATLADFIEAAAVYLRRGGKLAIVMTAQRTAELIDELRSHGLEPKRMRTVHPRLDQPASAVLIEARKGGGVELALEPPLILYRCAGSYSEEAIDLLGQRQP